MQSVFLRRPHKHKHTHTPHVHLRNQWRCGQVKKPIARACPRSPCTEEQTTKSEWMWPTKTHSSQNQFVCTFGCCCRCCCLPPSPTTKSIISFFCFSHCYLNHISFSVAVHTAIASKSLSGNVNDVPFCRVEGRSERKYRCQIEGAALIIHIHGSVIYGFILLLTLFFFLCCFDRVWHFVFLLVFCLLMPSPKPIVSGWPACQFKLVLILFCWFSTFICLFLAGKRFMSNANAI